MFNLLTELNWLAVLLADVAAFVLGGVWFVVLFPRLYASALGRENEPRSKPAAIFLVGCAFRKLCGVFSRNPAVSLNVLVQL